jgi:hypothetical protein
MRTDPHHDAVPSRVSHGSLAIVVVLSILPL